MSNMLRFRNIPSKAYVRRTQQAGATIADASTKPLPSKIGGLIRTIKGVHRVLPDEYARGTGVPKAWMQDETKVRADQAGHTTCINIWEAVAETIRQSFNGTNHTEGEDGIIY